MRWHFKDPHRLSASIPAVDDLTSDKFLFPHVAHNLSHLFFCAYKHFSFDPPYWLDEGLAHVLEIDSAKDLNITWCSDEGAGPDRERTKDWGAIIKTMIDRKKVTSLADLLYKKNFGDLNRDDHVSAWSKVKFLISAHPVKFAEFAGAIKGRLDDRGYPSGKDLPGVQRELLKSLWGWTPDEFDAAWAAWVMKQK
ncbi:MAG: hypothetical protein JNM63_16900 [Spirochaetia bacterium]|nr:hypothetical protein [Spirochaetia bacterium]